LTLILATGSAYAEPTRSINIILAKDEAHLLNLNQDNHSVSIFKVNPTGTAGNALKKSLKLPWDLSRNVSRSNPMTAKLTSWLVGFGGGHFARYRDH
jgi:hypothetical protein